MFQGTAMHGIKIDQEELIGYLIDGGLIGILTAGYGKPAVARIIPSELVAEGFVTFFEDAKEGSISIPVFALDTVGTRKVVFEPKNEEVVDYLINSFGLTEVDARYVIISVNVGQPVL